MYAQAKLAGLQNRVSQTSHGSEEPASPNRHHANLGIGPGATQTR